MFMFQHGVVGPWCVMGLGLVTVGEGNTEGGRGIPLQRHRQPGASARLSGHGHIHRTHPGGHCQAQTPAGACGDVMRPDMVLQMGPLPARHMRAHTCTYRHMHTCTHTHTQSRNYACFCLCTVG